MSTRVQLSIAGRGEADAPLLADMLGQLDDFVKMVRAAAASIAGSDAEQYDWTVVGLSKNSPACLVLEAAPRPGFSDGGALAARARDAITDGLNQLRDHDVRPLHWNDTVVDAADRFMRRITGRLAGTSIGDTEAKLVHIGGLEAVEVIENLNRVRQDDPVHPYRELGSLEGTIQNVGADGYGRPYIIVRSRLTGSDVRCMLVGEALRAVEQEPVANVVWRNRMVTAIGVLSYKNLGKLSQVEVARLDFNDPQEKLPQLLDIIDREFTGGLSSEEYLERLRDGEA